MQDKVDIIHQQLHTRDKKINDLKGWVDLPYSYNKSEFEHIQQVAKKIQHNSDILLVIGIGGSYLGAKAAIDMLNHNFYNLLPEEERKTPQVIFAGHNMSSNYISNVKDLLKNRDFSINVISKSGKTTEPAIALRIFKKILLERYGREEARNRMFVTTDAHDGALKSLADTRDYETFIIPKDIGGRYSVLTAVGLLPMAVSGIDITEVIKGAQLAENNLQISEIKQNDAYQYAVIRNLLYDQNKTVELLVNYEPNMESLSRWWQQLFGESEGKNKQGILPAFATFPTDLHSIGQYIQDGKRNMFETVIKVSEQENDEFIHHDANNLDDLNYLADKSLEEINTKIFKAAVLAHTDGEIPNLIIHVPQINAHTFGYLVYFFQKACAMSGFLFDVNPFDQPGVEAYKNKMYKLLGKPSN